MSDKAKFDIIFSGEIATDYALEAVKQKVAQLFKLKTERVEQLFTGAPVALKQHLDQATAEKYRAVLTKAGMVITVKPQSNNDDASSSHVEATVNNAGSTVPDWDIAEVGVRLSTPANDAPSPVIDSSLNISPQQGNLLRPEEFPKPVPAVDLPAIDEWELNQQGEALFKAEERKAREQAEQEKYVDIDVDHISVSENKGDLLRDNEKKKWVASDVDISAIHLAYG